MIEIGAKLTVEKTVTPELTAQVAGSGLLPVFGTPFMTAMMENAAAGILQQYLEEGKTNLVISVGCTGGHHRSVAVAQAIADFTAKRGYPT